MRTRVALSNAVGPFSTQWFPFPNIQLYLPLIEYFYRRQTTTVRLHSEPFLSFSMATFPLFASERSHLPLWLLALSSLLLALYYIHTYAKLRHIPGPFLASLSNLSRRSWVLSGNSHAIHVSLHRRYGKVVRFGPNNISVSDPSAIPEVYGFGAKFPKVNALVSAEKDAMSGRCV